MKLAAFFEAMQPLLAGAASADETARVLYGEAPSEDAARLIIYERMFRWRRAETLAGICARVHRFVVEQRGAHAWSDLCTAYYAEAPWRAVKPLPNTAGFAAFLGRVHAAWELPAWLAELADFEWWAAATRAALDSEDDPALGPLRLAPTAELRMFQHDLVAWVEDVETINPEPPAAGQFVVLFWRDDKAIACVRSVSSEEIRLLGAVHRGALGEPSPDERALVERLHAIGALVGVVPWVRV